jgi:hypothetical protein
LAGFAESQSSGIAYVLGMTPIFLHSQSGPASPDFLAVPLVSAALDDDAREIPTGHARELGLERRSNAHVAWVDRRCLDFDENLAAPQSRAFDIDKR